MDRENIKAGSRLAPLLHCPDFSKSSEARVSCCSWSFNTPSHPIPLDCADTGTGTPRIGGRGRRSGLPCLSMHESPGQPEAWTPPRSMGVAEAAIQLGVVN